MVVPKMTLDDLLSHNALLQEHLHKRLHFVCFFRGPVDCLLYILQSGHKPLIDSIDIIELFTRSVPGHLSI